MLKSRWSGPFVVNKAFPCDVVEITYKEKGTFKINEHRLKLYLCNEYNEKGKEVHCLYDPST